MDTSTPVLLQYGLAGVVILAQAAVIRYLWLELKAAHLREIAQVEARRADAKEFNDHFEQPLQAIAQSQQFIADKLTNSRRKG